jgi:two-component system alkaline phosphatase synthesis response regulator PhoP
MEKKPKVLIIEDEKFLCELVQKKLETAGMAAVGAFTGEDGLLAIGKDRPDIILLDLLLPGMDGFEVLYKIKSDETLKNIPVIVVSNLGERKEIEKAFQLGAAEYFVKTNHSLNEIVDKVWEYARKAA